MTRDRWSRSTRRSSRYEPVIGLETHVELGTATKMFCGCPTAFGAEPNTQVCPVCLGLPGSLPVANRTAIEYDDPHRAGAELHDRRLVPVRPEELLLPGHAEELPDLASTTSRCASTATWTSRSNGKTVRVGIERVHLEEDTGKSLHVGGATGRIHGADYSLVDYNRAGIPLVEIVTKPVAGTGAVAPEVARPYVTELRDLLRSLGVSDVRMEQGSLRCDVNTSLTPRGARRVGHPHRDQERQLAALGRAGGALRDRAAGRGAGRAAAGSSRRPGTSTRTPATTTPGPVQGGGPGLPVLPRARPGAGRARPRTGWSSIRAALPELPRPRAGPGCRPSGACPSWTWHAHAPTPARSTWSRRRSRPARRRPTRASGGWASWPGGPTTTGVELADLPITPAQVARVVALVAAGALNDKLARQVLEGVLAGEGDARRGGRGAAGWPWSPTTARWPPRSTRPSPPTRTSPRRSAAARSPRPARWSAR